MGSSSIDGVPANQILAMLRKSIKEDWPVTPEQKSRSVEIIAEIIENAEGKFSPKDVLTATRVQLDMANANIKNAIAIDYAHFQREKFEVLSNLEKQISHSLADGPPTDPIVSDSPMPALEYIDVEMEPPDTNTQNSEDPLP